MFGQRLKEERIKNQLSQEDLADKLDVKKNTVWNWENEKSYPNALQIMDFLDFGFDVQYILTGKKQPPDGLDEEEFVLVPFFDVEVSAGFGTYSDGVTDPSSYLAFRRDWLRDNGLKEKDLNCVLARGDSMEPTIGNRDTLLVDTSRSTPRDGHIYVIRSNDSLWVKRVQKQIDGTLLLLSDNEAYPPMTLHLDQHPDIQIIGQVMNVSRDLS